MVDPLTTPELLLPCDDTRRLLQVLQVLSSTLSGLRSPWMMFLEWMYAHPRAIYRHYEGCHKPSQQVKEKELTKQTAVIAAMV
jgi:hypothetical protein